MKIVKIPKLLPMIRWLNDRKNVPSTNIHTQTRRGTRDSAYHDDAIELSNALGYEKIVKLYSYYTAV